MKKELTDLIPVEGLLKVCAKSDLEIKKNYSLGRKGEISFVEFNWRSFKDASYNLLVAGYNFSVFYGIFKAIEHFN